MSQVKLYQNMLAKNGFTSAGFTLSGFTAVDSFGLEHLYDNDPTSYFRGSGVGTNCYVRGQWAVPDVATFDHLYVSYGASVQIDLIDLETEDPEFPGWSLVTKTDVIGSPAVTIVSSGVYLDQPTEPGWFLLSFSTVAASENRYRIAVRANSAWPNVGLYNMYMAMPLHLLDLPEAARTKEIKGFAYGTSRATTLGGKTQYASYGVDPRRSFSITYEYISETDRDTILDLYSSCKGGTYPFLLRIDDDVYPALFSDSLSVVEEQAGLYNVTLSLETL
ncbi:hypothetical protein KDA08_02855 [Candidatus Saccharibacteria bacterium]|nr:hypothetical protein [Candidatus Saccharibacteria bacterium]